VTAWSGPFGESRCEREACIKMCFVVWRSEGYSAAWPCVYKVVLMDYAFYPTCVWKRLLLHFPGPDPKTSFSGPGDWGRSQNLFGFWPTRIDVDQVSAQTVDSGTQSWHLCKLCLLGWGTTCFELRVLSGIASRNSIVGVTYAGPSFERLSFERLSFEKCRKTVFQKTVPRRSDFNDYQLFYTV